MKLEFIIPASPTPGFFSQIAMFRLALDRLGGPYATARVVAVFGDNADCVIPEPWLEHLHGVEIERVSIKVFKEDGYLAQVYRRFDLLDPSADLSVICDADILPVRPFGDDIWALVDAQALGGVIAHSHFPWQQRTDRGAEDWQIFAQATLGRRIDTPFSYTLSDKAPCKCPFYINFGFLVGPPKVLGKVHAEAQRVRRQVRALLGNYFEAQVTWALATSAAGVPTRALPMRYNFPNDPTADARYPEELKNASMMHYLRLTHFDRQKIFADPAEFSKFLAIDLAGSNAAFQEAVHALTGGSYPFKLSHSSEICDEPWK